MKDKVKGRSKLKRFVARYLLRYYMFYLLNFNRDKLKGSLAARKEREIPTCKGCGRCCVNCVAFSSLDKCKIYEHRDYLCSEYPFLPIQLKLDNLESECRYYWD